jgi:hypothetical protein
MIVTQTGTAMGAMTGIKGTGIGEIATAAIGTEIDNNWMTAS